MDAISTSSNKICVLLYDDGINNNVIAYIYMH